MSGDHASKPLSGRPLPGRQVPPRDFAAAWSVLYNSTIRFLNACSLPSNKVACFYGHTIWPVRIPFSLHTPGSYSDRLYACPVKWLLLLSVPAPYETSPGPEDNFLTDYSV